MSEDDGRRHTKAGEAPVVRDPQIVAELESANALKQFDRLRDYVRDYTDTQERSFKLRQSMILALHRAAMEGLSSYAGTFRAGPVEIGASTHKPPHESRVPELIEELCDYVNENWSSKSAFHLSAYVLWRLNWIHAFTDGNGRTSRAVSYAVLCIKLGYLIPGRKAIPEQIAANRQPYYDYLGEADRHWAEGRVDVSKLEQLISAALAEQLADVHKRAGLDGEGQTAG